MFVATFDLTIPCRCVCAVIQNVDKLFTLIVLALLYMYTEMVIGLFLVKEGINQDYCSNMFQCIQTITDLSIRDYGVNGVLGYPGDVYRYPSNLIDGLGIYADAREAGVFFIKTILWDVSFQILFSRVMIAIVVGIICDGFSELKAKREANEEDLDRMCFVCNLQRWRLDQVEFWGRLVLPCMLGSEILVYTGPRLPFATALSRLCYTPHSFNAYPRF